jgi:hypothetical protein
MDAEGFDVHVEGDLALDFASGTRCEGRNRDKKAGEEHRGKD